MVQKTLQQGLQGARQASYSAQAEDAEHVGPCTFRSRVAIGDFHQTSQSARSARLVPCSRLIGIDEPDRPLRHGGSACHRCAAELRAFFDDVGHLTAHMRGPFANVDDAPATVMAAMTLMGVRMGPTASYASVCTLRGRKLGIARWLTARPAVILCDQRQTVTTKNFDKALMAIERVRSSTEQRWR